MTWRIGYNTNGFQSHRLMDALKVMAEIGYNSVALTLDHCHLDPFHTPSAELQAVRSFLDDHNMSCVVETGARYLLDRWRKHYPSLISKERQKRLEFLKRAVDIAAELGALCVSFFSGAPDTPQEMEQTDQLFERLFRTLEELLSHSQGSGVTLALEPEPGMVVESLADYLYVKQKGGFSQLKLTLDLGHVFCLGNLPVAQAIHAFSHEIANVHIEDMPRNRHLHLPFGEGEMDFPPIFQALNKVGPLFPLHVELSRDSHRAPLVAKEAFQFLSQHLYGFGTGATG